MKRFTVRGFRYPEGSPLARLQELENKLEDGEIAAVIPSLNEDLYRKINDLEMALSSAKEMAKFYKHKYFEAKLNEKTQEVAKKIFSEFDIRIQPIYSPEMWNREYMVLKQKDYVRLKVKYTGEEQNNDGERADSRASEKNR